MQFKALAMIAAAFVSTTAVAWPNRDQVVRTAEVLQDHTMKVFATLAAAALSLAGTAQAHHGTWPNKPVVLANAEALADRVELLDESLHELNASEEVIEVIHHFEETVLAAIEEFQELHYDEARVELDHLREDIFLVYDKLDQANFFNSVDAIYAWNDVLMTYIRLERSMDWP